VIKYSLFFLKYKEKILGIGLLTLVISPKLTAGMYNKDSSPTVVNSIFLGNAGASSIVSSIYNGANVMANCTIFAIL
jgi:hypothetical protein